MAAPQSVSGTCKIEFERFSFDSHSGQLTQSDGKELYLEPRLSNLFQILASNIGKLISRKELIKTVWSESLVNDESLTRAVSDLRKLLLENYGDSLSIKTIPKRGYILVYSKHPVRTSKSLKFLKYFSINLAILALLILIIRGLNY